MWLSMQHANCQMQGEAELAVPAPRSCRNRAHELSAALVSCRLEFLRPMIGAPADPPFNNYQAFHSNYAGLKILADTVREHERQYAATIRTLNMSCSTPSPRSRQWFLVRSTGSQRRSSTISVSLR